VFKKTVLTLLLLLALSNLVWAADDLLVAILKNGVGLRAASMGGAFTALADDPSAVFYNPAGLALQGIGFLKGYNDLNYRESTDFEHTFFAANSFGYGFWKKTDTTGKKAEVFAYSAGKQGTGGISYGMTYKNINTSGASPESSGYGYDIGLIGNFSRTLRWGILLQDIIENTGVPASARVGIASRFFPSLVGTVDFEFRDVLSSAGPTIYGHAGLENIVTPGFKLRGGYDQNRWTAGAAVSISVVAVEYALMAARSDGSAPALQMIGFKVSL